jgi:hypothetical protein
MARSFKTYAHAMFLTTGDRILSIATKPDFYLKCAVTDTGKVFTLVCAGDENVTVKSADHGGKDSVRDIADQLVARLATRSGAKAEDMSISEGAARPRVSLNLAPLNLSKKASK